jgi:hypothetical protein
VEHRGEPDLGVDRGIGDVRQPEAEASVARRDHAVDRAGLEAVHVVQHDPGARERRVVEQHAPAQLGHDDLLRGSGAGEEMEGEDEREERRGGSEHAHVRA